MALRGHVNDVWTQVSLSVRSQLLLSIDVIETDKVRYAIQPQRVITRIKLKVVQIYLLLSSCKKSTWRLKN